MSSRSVLSHLTNGQTSVVVVGDGGMPEIAHWGEALGSGPIDPELFVRPVVGGGLDVDPPMGLVAEASTGWFGRPGIEGCRPGGRDFAPRFSVIGIEADDRHLVIELIDDQARLHLELGLALLPSGVLTLDAVLGNDGPDDYLLTALRLALPIPDRAGEILTLGGRHLYEFSQQRSAWSSTAVSVENRRGKTSHERLGVIVAGTAGFGEHTGDVWGCHVGWSGNYELYGDAVTDARKVVQAGEILQVGELVLAPGERYRAPTVFGAYSGKGLNSMSEAFHTYLRGRPNHPRLPRPVHLNTWEAVYFDHDLPTLMSLADVAAKVGIERFGLDDGWFGGRRDDHRGLGDWSVSPEAWPDGLSPIIDHVRGLGMEFGIWVEPEMVNPDSELFREHPDWALVDHRYPPVLGRNQLVLDVGRPEVRDHLFEALDALLANHDIAYVKWDHNRDLVAPTSRGAAGTHGQTVGFYELLDRLRAAHPGVEFETCASGGGRVDFGVLERTDRVWTSDSLDALDRQAIQRGFSLLFPPELMGAHIGSPVTHATLRQHRLGLRAIAAFFGAMGVEWNLLELDDDQRNELARLIGLHRTHRDLLHTGRVLRCDHPDPTVEAHGVVAGDGSEALVAVTRLASGPSHHTAPLRIPWLTNEQHYRVQILEGFGEPLGHARQQPDWITGGLEVPGRQLATAGLRVPQLHPENGIVIHLVAVDRTRGMQVPADEGR